jgi:hypothetical protein
MQATVFVVSVGHGLVIIIVRYLSTTVVSFISVYIGIHLLYCKRQYIVNNILSLPRNGQHALLIRLGSTLMIGKMPNTYMQLYYFPEYNCAVSDNQLLYMVHSLWTFNKVDLVD